MTTTTTRGAWSKESAPPPTHWRPVQPFEVMFLKTLMIQETIIKYSVNHI